MRPELKHRRCAVKRTPRVPNSRFFVNGNSYLPTTRHLEMPALKKKAGGTNDLSGRGPKSLLRYSRCVRRGRWIAGTLVAACWLSAGSRPFVDAVLGAAEPADWARDYVTARLRLEEGRGAPPAAEEGNERAVRYGVPRVALLGAPYFIHPPTATLATLPFAVLPWRVAAMAWAAASVVALAWLAISLLGLWTPGVAPPVSRVALLTLALVLWPPTLYCLEKGQWSIWLAALLAAGFRSLQAKRTGPSGSLFGVAAALKITPIVMLGYLLLRSRRAVVAMLATAGGAALVALAAIGPTACFQFAAGA